MEHKEVIKILRVATKNNFLMKNLTVIGDNSRSRIGVSISATNAILARNDELSVYMPKIIGTSPNNQNWDTKLREYFNSIAVDVPESGKDLDIGFKFDKNSPAVKEFINDNKASLISDGKLNEAKLVDMLVSTIDREEWYKYGFPSNVANFVLYRYIKNYKAVANDIDDVEKSKDIRFYIVNNNLIAKKRADAAKAIIDATNEFLTISSDSVMLRAIVDIAQLPVEDIYNDNDVFLAVDDFCHTNPHKFLSIARHAHVKTMGKIEALIRRGILTRVENTDMIVSADNAVSLGSDMNEAVSFFINKENEVTVNRWIAAAKNTPK